MTIVNAFGVFDTYQMVVFGKTSRKARTICR